MARINLLPWREEKRLRKNKEFATLLVMVFLLAAAVAAATWFFFNNELLDQQSANQNIVEENTRLDGVLKEIEDLEKRRDDIESRMKVIQDLQGRRPVPVRVWDDMAKAMPETLYLTEMVKENNTVILYGRADNPNVVSALIRNLDASQWMNYSAVRNIEKETEKLSKKGSSEVLYPENNYVKFEITTQIQNINKKNDDESSESNDDTAGGQQ